MAGEVLGAGMKQKWVVDVETQNDQGDWSMAGKVMFDTEAEARAYAKGANRDVTTSAGARPAKPDDRNC